MPTPAVQRRALPWRDPGDGGALTWAKRDSDTDTYSVDLSEWLSSSETYSAVTTEDTVGVTLGSVTLSAAGALSVPVTSGTGSTVVKATTSASRVLRLKLAWRALDYENATDAYA